VADTTPVSTAAPDTPGATRAFPDLRATVFIDTVPAGACADLESLYSNLFSTCDWFESHDDEHATGAVVLDDPRHLLLFYLAGDTVEVLNKVIDIQPSDVRRARTALLRALPGARRIHLEVKFPPRDLRVPKRVLYWTDDHVIELPGSAEEYHAALGKSTRRNLRLYENRLRRAFPDVSTQIIAPGDDARRLFDQHLEWKVERFRALGQTTYWEKLPDRVDLFVDLLERRGEAHVTSLGGKPAGIVFTFPVGQTLNLYAYAFDPSCSYFHLGLLIQHWVILDAIDRGLTRVHMLWGTSEYKSRLGAHPVRGTRVSLFRSQPAKLFSLRELAVVGRRRYKDAREAYWSARHAARRLVDGLRRSGDGEQAA
jgi:CelD/BcsL family acetyltransferase involved in cellulose biosynthesis